MASLNTPKLDLIERCILKRRIPVIWVYYVDHVDHGTNLNFFWSTLQRRHCHVDHTLGLQFSPPTEHIQTNEQLILNIHSLTILIRYGPDAGSVAEDVASAAGDITAIYFDARGVSKKSTIRLAGKSAAKQTTTNIKENLSKQTYPRGNSNAYLTFVLRLLASGLPGRPHIAFYCYSSPLQ